MLITVSGPPGSGKSTTASALAERFGLEHTSGGDIFRSMAHDRGLSLAELNAQAEEDPVIDKQLDQRLQEIARTEDDIVLESRLAGWLAGDDATFRLWLDAPLSVRAERIADREDKTVAAAREETETREDSERQRYREYYGIDIADLSIYDICLNTARWGPATVPTVLADAIEQYDASIDEGQASFDPIIIDI